MGFERTSYCVENFLKEIVSGDFSIFWKISLPFILEIKKRYNINDRYSRKDVLEDL